MFFGTLKTSEDCTVFRCLIWSLFLGSLSVTRLDANIASATSYNVREDGYFSCALGLSYTYWYPYQDDLSIYTDVDPQGDVGTESNPKSTVYYPSIEARSGFQVFGSVGIWDNWDLLFQYTWFYNNDNPYTRQPLPTGATAADDNPSLRASWPLGEVALEVDDSEATGFIDGRVSSVWNNMFNRIDLVLGKIFFSCDDCDMSSFFGLVGAWEEQRFSVSFGSYKSGEEVVEWDAIQNWWGIGPSVGIRPSYHIWSADSMDNCLSICASGSIAFLGSYVDVLTSQFAIEYGTVAIYRNELVRVSPGLDLFLGICWEVLCDEMTAIKVMLGWESQVWFAHSYIYPFFNDAGAGLYYMQGLNLSLVFCF